MKLIVGIGNPDKEYLETRHNVGWVFLDWLNRKYGGSEFEMNKKLSGEVAEGDIDGSKSWLFKPHTYVNESGKAVAPAKKWAKAKNEDIIVVQDDLDVPFGTCKLSFGRNAGGHRGIESIIKSMKTNKFDRSKIGLATPGLKKARKGSAKSRDEWVKGYVLKKFTASEREKLKAVFKDCEIRLLQAFKN
jgi:PTH1 family peptidyl-tRNA hydrolase